MTANRTILLRRPANLSVVDGPFVPAGAPGLLDDVDRRWAALRRRNPAYFDSSLYHVLGVHRNGCGGAVLHVAECAYRFHAVQDDRFDLGVRPLGVKGIVVRGGAVLVGRRADHVAGYPGRWEFAPGGVVEPGARPGATPAAAIARELREETGLTASREPTAIAVLYDDVLRTWEMVFRIDAGPGAADRSPETDEYSVLEWREPGRLPEDLTPVACAMVPMVESVVR